MAEEPGDDLRFRPAAGSGPALADSPERLAEAAGLFRETGLPVELSALEGSHDPVFLRWAARRAEELGIGGDELLRARASFDSDHYLRRLAARLQLTIDWLDGDDAGDAAAAEILKTGVLRRRDETGAAMLTVAPRGTAIRAVHDALRTNAGLHEFVRIASPERLRRFVERTRADALAHDAAFQLRDEAPRFSAALRSPAALRASGIAGILISGAATYLWYAYALLALESLLAVAFSLFIALKFFACFGPGAPKLQPSVHRLPVYSVLVPLYKEANMVRALAANLSALDYPHEKLDVKLIVEPDDFETRAALDALSLDRRFEIFVAPGLGPRTKPKALSAALPFARGELIVVYDAEDEPAPDQLRIAAAAFAEAGPELACVQASLAIRNAGDNWLTKHFAAEYAGLFDVFLPALAGKRLPLPLGGTSNHFRAATLREVGGWDPHNVTEDADLGMRLARFGFRTGVIDSTTMEEAPGDFRNWLNQRTRWFKGWLQTWLVHMREPRRLYRDLGAVGFFAFQLLLGGALLAALVHPAFAVALAWKAITGDMFHASATNPYVTRDAMLLLVLAGGYLSAVALAAKGLHRRRVPVSVWLLATIPLYWLLLSLAAWRAVVELIVRPHYWAKTEHGKSIGDRAANTSGAG